MSLITAGFEPTLTCYSPYPRVVPWINAAPTYQLFCSLKMLGIDTTGTQHLPAVHSALSVVSGAGAACEAARTLHLTELSHQGTFY